MDPFVDRRFWRRRSHPLSPWPARGHFCRVSQHSPPERLGAAEQKSHLELACSYKSAQIPGEMLSQPLPIAVQQLCAILYSHWHSHCITGSVALHHSVSATEQLSSKRLAIQPGKATGCTASAFLSMPLPRAARRRSAYPAPGRAGGTGAQACMFFASRRAPRVQSRGLAQVVQRRLGDASRCRPVRLHAAPISALQASQLVCTFICVVKEYAAIPSRIAKSRAT